MTETMDLLDLVPDQAPAGSPSPAQARLMDSLISQLHGLDMAVGVQAEGYTQQMAGRWTPGRDGNASAWIDRMIAKVKELRSDRPAPVELKDGMYLKDGDIFKLQYAVHGSGRLYAKRLVPPAIEGERASFEYAPGMVARLQPEDRMTLDQAKEYGALYGVCIRCGKVLTKETSIERAMGDTCASKI